MKALYNLTFVAILVLATGCATLGGAAVGSALAGKEGAAVGAVAGAIYDSKQKSTFPQQRYYSSEGICDPIRAQALMGWAQELDGGKYHHRNADIVKDSYYGKRCVISESAGSHTGGRR